MTLDGHLMAIADYFDAELPQSYDPKYEDLINLLLRMGYLRIDVSQGRLKRCSNP